jgi:hypothetical protein
MKEEILTRYEYEVYLELFHEQGIEWMYPRETIYLDTDPEVCLQRIRDRNREGEQKMDLEWLNKCQKNHEEFFRQNNIEPKTIKGNNTDMESRDKWTCDIFEWCDNLVDTTLKGPDTDNLKTGGESGGIKNSEESTPKFLTDTPKYSEKHTTDIGRIEELPIKLKYESRNQYVIIDSYSFEELVKLAYDAFPEVREKDIEGFNWRVEKGGVTGIVYGDADLKFAIESMIAWERPVIRLEIVCMEEDERDSGAVVIPDEEIDRCHDECHC